jgi:hypothetical protein
MKKLLFALTAAVFITGCASMSTRMENPTTGQDYTCAAHGWGWFGTPAAIIMHHRCVADMEAQGYVRASN